jgi:hypothetical protein
MRKMNRAFFTILLVNCIVAVAENSANSDPTAAVTRGTAPMITARESGSAVMQAGGCAGEIEPNSAAPLWDSPAETTPCGLIETDNLLIEQTPGSGVHQKLMLTTAKYGLTSHLEIRWELPGRVTQSGGGIPRLGGSTDQLAGVCWRFHDKGRWVPDLALDYAVKIPTANPAKSFGSGYADNQLTVIASRDLGDNHIDFNAAGTIAGGPRGPDGSAQLGLAFSRTITSRLLLAIETFGGSQPGTSDRYGAGLFGGAWSIHPWLALNGAYLRAYTSGSPHEQLLVGFIYTMRPGFGRHATLLSSKF